MVGMRASGSRISQRPAGYGSVLGVVHTVSIHILRMCGANPGERPLGLRVPQGLLKQLLPS